MEETSRMTFTVQNISSPSIGISKCIELFISAISCDAMRDAESDERCHGFSCAVSWVPTETASVKNRSNATG